MSRLLRGRWFFLAAVVCVLGGAAWCAADIKKNALFGMFFMGIGFLLLVLGTACCCSAKTGRILRRCLLWACVLLLCGFGVLEGFVIEGSRGQVDGTPDVIIVPGAALRADGTPGEALTSRLLTALEQLEQYPESVVVVSGGQGSDEPLSEAQSMSQWLETQGIAETRIILESASQSTSQNFSYSLDLLENMGYDLDTTRILIVSSDYHLFRAKLLAERRCTLVSTLGVPAVSLFQSVYNYVREPFAVVKELLLQ